MKKQVITTILAVALVAILTFGCSAPAAETPATSTEQPIAEETAQGEEQTPDAGEPEPLPDENAQTDEGAENPEAIEGESVYGKVKSIVGNEIELELAKPPFEDVTGGAEGTGAGMKSAGTVSFRAEGADGGGAQSFEVAEAGDSAEGAMVVSGTVDAGDAVGDAGSAQTIVAVEGADGKMQIIGGEGGNDLELEYTGETKSIIIPAGAEIMNMTGEGTLESIKKGSVLMLTVKDAEQERAVASHVMIWG